jgi:hypothetical protein
MALVITAVCLVSSLCKKDPVEPAFYTNLQIVDEAVTQNTRILMTIPSLTQFIGFVTDYQKEKSAVEVYITASLIVTVNENTKQTSERSYLKRNTELKTDLSSQVHVQCSHEELTDSHISHSPFVA